MKSVLTLVTRVYIDTLQYPAIIGGNKPNNAISHVFRVRRWVRPQKLVQVER